MGKHQPALLGGVFIGVLSSLPVVNVANCCCLWVITGGMLAVYLQQQRTPEPVETADAVIGGLLAGLVGAVIVGVLSAAMAGVTGPVGQEALQRALEQSPEMPPEVRNLVTRLMSGQGLVLLMLVVTIPLFAVFSTLGALLGLALFRKKVPPAAAS